MIHSCPTFEALNHSRLKPIVWDRQTGQYYLTLPKAGRNRVVLRYCPWCGASISKNVSERPSEPLQKEIIIVKRLLRGVTSITEVVERLGKPDREFNLGPASKSTSVKKRSSFPGYVTTQVDYLNVAESFELCVQQLVNGTIQYLFCPKARRKASTTRGFPRE